MPYESRLMIRCMVRNCLYVAEEAFEDFQVCSLHHHENVRAFLERLEAPTAYWVPGAPIVMSTGALTEDDFRPVEATGLVRAHEDVRLVNEIDERTNSEVYPKFRLL